MPKMRFCLDLLTYREGLYAERGIMYKKGSVLFGLTHFWYLLVVEARETLNFSFPIRHPRWIIRSALQHIATLLTLRPSTTKIVPHIISMSQCPRSGVQIGVMVICCASGSHYSKRLLY